MGSYLNKSTTKTSTEASTDPTVSTSKNPAAEPKKAFGPDGNKVEFSSESAADFLDVVFCIDTTGSMSSYIERSKKVIINMINYFSQNEEKPLFGIVAYRDHPPQETSYITKMHQLSNADNALAFVKALEAQGGGDTPEAVLQGLYDSVEKIKWRNINQQDKTYKKLVIHVADAPAHGKEFHNGSVDDHWPDGCPSGIKLDKLAKCYNDKVVFYHFCRLNTTTDVMHEKFKKAFNNFELIDLMVDAENIQEQKKEFEAYKAEHHIKEYDSMAFEKMDMQMQNECLYEAKVTNVLSRNMKKK